MKYILLLALIGCVSEEEVAMSKAKKVMKEQLMHDYLETLTMEQRVFMKSCMSGYEEDHRCIERMRRLGTGEAPKIKSGPSTTDIAVGTAVEIGATKLLFGK